MRARHKYHWFLDSGEQVHVVKHDYADEASLLSLDAGEACITVTKEQAMTLYGALARALHPLKRVTRTK